jgi:hypothetical protein
LIIFIFSERFVFTYVLVQGRLNWGSRNTGKYTGTHKSVPST